MAVNGADVVETKFFEQRGRYDHALGVFFDALGQFEQRRRALSTVLPTFLAAA